MQQVIKEIKGILSDELGISGKLLASVSEKSVLDAELGIRDICAVRFFMLVEERMGLNLARVNEEQLVTIGDVAREICQARRLSSRLSLAVPLIAMRSWAPRTVAANCDLTKTPQLEDPGLFQEGQ